MTKRSDVIAPKELAVQWHGPLLSTKEAAAITRLSLQTLAQKRLLGNFCPYVKLGSRVFYPEDALRSYIAGRLRSSTSDRTA